MGVKKLPLKIFWKYQIVGSGLVSFLEHLGLGCDGSDFKLGLDQVAL